MDVRMMQQGLAPGVENHRLAQLGAGCLRSAAMVAIISSSSRNSLARLPCKTFSPTGLGPVNVKWVPAPVRPSAPRALARPVPGTGQCRLRVVSKIFRTFDQATASVCVTCG